MGYLFAGIIASGPPVSPGHHVRTDPNHVTYVWSHNWAAVIGCIICILLLHAWISTHPWFNEDPGADKDPPQF